MFINLLLVHYYEHSASCEPGSCKIHFNIILQFNTLSPSWLAGRLHVRTLRSLHLPVRTTCPVIYPLLPCFNLLKPTVHVMHQHLKHSEILHFAHTVFI
jgi:hypothetical protein